MNRISELKALKNLRPCVDKEKMFRIDGRLENATLAVDAKHPLILPGKHALTRLVVLHEHVQAGHAGPSYTFMKTRLKFWIVHGIACVKRFLNDCSICARRKTTLIHQLRADCRLGVLPLPINLLNFALLIIVGLLFSARLVASVKRAGSYFSLVYALVAYMLNS